MEGLPDPQFLLEEFAPEERGEEGGSAVATTVERWPGNVGTAMPWFPEMQREYCPVLIGGGRDAERAAEGSVRGTGRTEDIANRVNEWMRNVTPVESMDEEDARSHFSL